MAKFLKIQDYYINVEQIHHILIKENEGIKTATIHLDATGKAFNFINSNGTSYTLTNSEVLMLEKFLDANTLNQHLLP